MAYIIYTVLAEFDDPAVCEEFINWLRDDHIEKVIAAGALTAEVTRLDREPDAKAEAEVRYRFSDRASFARYVEQSAPGLRAEGLARFGPGRGVRMKRRLGELVYE